MKTHDLKCWTAVFQPLIDGTKTFEYRKNDRNFEVGDILCEREWNPDTQEYSGREISLKVNFIVHGGAFGIPSGYAIMSVSPVPAPSPALLLGDEEITDIWFKSNGTYKAVAQAQLAHCQPIIEANERKAIYKAMQEAKGVNAKIKIMDRLKSGQSPQGEK